jgi:hypothetical protein
MRIAKRLFVLNSLIFLGTVPCLGSITYTYLGNPFTQIPNGSSYTTSDFVSGSITLSSPLPSDSSLTSYLLDVTALNFTDGVQTINTLNSNDIVEFATSGGAITSWTIAIFTSVTGDQINTQYSNPQGMDNYDQGSVATGNYGLVTYNPGQWSPTPEPSSIGLMFAAAAMLVGARFLRPAPKD